MCESCARLSFAELHFAGVVFLRQVSGLTKTARFDQFRFCIGREGGGLTREEPLPAVQAANETYIIHSLLRSALPHKWIDQQPISPNFWGIGRGDGVRQPSNLSQTFVQGGSDTGQNQFLTHLSISGPCPCVSRQTHHHPRSAAWEKGRGAASRAVKNVNGNLNMCKDVEMNTS